MKTVVTVDSQGRKTALQPCLEPCPIERGMRLLGGKWKASILWHLKEMEKAGLVERHVQSTRPIAVAYTITDFGRSALGILDQLRVWSEEQDV